MSQLYRLPNGKIVVLYAHPTLTIAARCPRCSRWATKWHEHLTNPGEKIVAKSLWVKT